MNDWKERFKREYSELLDRCVKLEKMLKDWEELDFSPHCSKSLLEAQLMFMTAYLGVLTERAKIEGIEL